MKKILPFITSAVLMLALLWAAPPVAATGATLSLNPSSGSYLVNSSFDVSLYLNTGGQAVNAVNVVINFPADKLQVVNPSAGNSFISIWVSQPTFNNSTGTITLSGGLPHPGVTSSAALVTTVTFRVKAPGSAKITLSNDSSVLADDGSGTNILTSKISSNVSLNIPPPNGPDVISSTHPDPNVWNQSKTVDLSWDKDQDVTDFSYTLNQDPATIPDETTQTTDDHIELNNIPDGVNYFHLRAKNRNGWGGTTHFMIRVDSTPPAKFTPTIYPNNRTARTSPLVNFFTTDAASGIDHYEVRLIDLDQKGTGESTFFTEQSNPYKLPDLHVGHYSVIVRAIDKANNYDDEQIDLEIVPKILPFNEDVVGFIEALPVTNLILIFLFTISLVSSAVIYIRKRRLGLAGRVSQDVDKLQQELADIKVREQQINDLQQKMQQPHP